MGDSMRARIEQRAAGVASRASRLLRRSSSTAGSEQAQPVETDGAARTAERGEGSALSPDRPLSDPATDRLGYAPFAAALAEAVRRMEAPDGIVVALYGQWGLGKTTALNFIEHYLTQHGEGGAGELVILRFNPWLFTGRMDLAVAYLAELQKTFQRWRLVADNARRALSSLAKLVSGAPVPGASMAKSLGEALDPGAPDVRELKQEIADALAAQPRRLVVVIDDIDRLTPDEIRELFSVIKAVADFPNTVYLLAFDDDVVASALSADDVDGRAYVEKIVQVPFELPIPEPAALQALFLEQLEAIVGDDVDPDLLNNEDLATLLHFGLMPLMATPRDVVRLTNSLRVTYAAVRGEVNVVDFVGLEAARIFLPQLYESVRARPEMFGAARGLEEAFRAMQADELAGFHQKWANAEAINEDKLEAAKELAGFLFPQTAQPLGIHLRRSRTVLESRRHRHVTNPDFYPLYFRLTLGDAAISRDLVAAMVERSADPAAFREALLELARETTASGRTRASFMLDELVGQAGRFEAAALAELIAVLVSVGDELWIESDDQFLGGGNDLRIWSLVEALLARINKADRAPLLVRAIEEGDSVATPVRIVASLGHWFGLEEGSIRDVQIAAGMDDSALIDSAALRQLEEAAGRRIARAAQDGQLFATPRAPLVLTRWAAWANDADVRAWVDGVRADDERLGRLLVAFLQTATTRSGEIVHRLNPRWLERYADRAALANDVRRLEPSAAGEVAVAVAQFLTELDMLERGQDPDWPQRGR
jgi:predicted KAP-like P-loop ATPase